MGRKTNSVSLRLKKTNRDYNNCWYGDILYSENFSKSLKIGKYLSQTLKTIGLPTPQLSVVGAFKKANLLVCYLDPKKRQRLLEKSSKGFMQVPKALQTSRKATTDSITQKPERSWPFSLSLTQKPSLNNKPGFSFFSLDEKKQEQSKTLLKPLQPILNTDFSLAPCLQHESYSSLGLASSTNPDFEAKVAFEHEKEKKSYGFKKALKANSEQSINGEKYVKSSKAIDKSVLTILNMKQDNNTLKKTTKLNCCYHGSIGLEFLQNKQLHHFHGCKDVQGHSYNIHALGSTTALVAPRTRQLKRLKQENDKQSKDQSSTFSCLNNIFFIKKEKKAISSDLLPFTDDKIGVTNNSLFIEPKPLWKNSPLPFNDQQSDFLFSKKDKQERKSEILGPKFFPYRFENTYKTDNLIKFKYFSDFFCNGNNETSFLFLISAFSKNSKIFGKKIDLNYISPFQSKPFIPKLVLSASNFNFNEKGYIDKKQFSKKEKISLTALTGFYNGFSRFWENVVSLSFYRSTNETSCALFLADTVSYLLEKKVLFRSIKRQILLELNQSKFAFSRKETSGLPIKKTDKDKDTATGPKSSAFALLSQVTSTAFENKKKVTGIRISCKGRVGGRSKKAQRSRKDTLMWGETGLHVFSSRLDFAKTHAETPFGLVGVQVWVCTK